MVVNHLADKVGRFLTPIQIEDQSNVDVDTPSDQIFKSYDALSREQGIDRLYFLLSLDCDTPEDIAAAAELDPWLRQLGIKRTYAVPGVMLQQGASVYYNLQNNGADFINHGALPHAEWRENRYWSISFYNEMPDQEVINDIQQGHQIFKRVLGRVPLGFRAPHFGCIQSEEQWLSIYRTLENLGYLFSTSRIPQIGYTRGPVFKIYNNIFEIPVSGSYTAPYNCFDSWTMIKDPTDPIVKDEYAVRFIETLNHLLEMNICGILNYYIDPAHVCRNTIFSQAMTYLIDRGVASIDYNDALEIIKK